MSLKRILALFSLLAALACLAVGFLAAGLVPFAAAAILPALSMILARKPSAGWLAPLALVISLCLAAGGVLAKAPPFWMILGATLFLAGWDLVLLERTTPGEPSPQSRRYESKHFQSLALALGLGLLVAELGRNLRFQIPFWIMALLVILAIFALDRALKNLLQVSNTPIKLSDEQNPSLPQDSSRSEKL